ncbi:MULTISPECIES: hypothetical protein [Halorussus]|uniref:hypothetical protein n=1 Tax=Halorussus TaxID=1070314 RepID=UPI00209DE5B0|nr:hypothetical protein [Halorussus vallis]USZ75973.1 hypothetical protein NGM07_01305 [Halorussus vallis]
MNFDRGMLHQLGGVTGLGWTTSMLGYASAVLGVGGGYLARFSTDPQSFLYAGGVLFLATLGLDRLARSASDD